MKIAMIGTGYVGLVSGVCFSDFGHDVVCVDKDPKKVEMLERGEVPIYEPGLDDLMAKNVAAGRLSFTGDLKAAVDGAEAVFIAVGTPTRRGDGHADLTYVMAAAAEIAATKAAGGRVIPVGTTALRLIESAARDCGTVQPWEGETDIFIYPGFDFQVADGLMTNFHLPKSTLMMLVSALIGQDRIREIYAHAITKSYRFFSYGDASLLLPHGAGDPNRPQ